MLSVTLNNPWPIQLKPNWSCLGKVHPTTIFKTCTYLVDTYHLIALPNLGSWNCSGSSSYYNLLCTPLLTEAREREEMDAVESCFLESSVQFGRQNNGTLATLAFRKWSKTDQRCHGHIWSARLHISVHICQKHLCSWTNASDSAVSRGIGGVCGFRRKLRMVRKWSGSPRSHGSKLGHWGRDAMICQPFPQWKIQVTIQEYPTITWATQQWPCKVQRKFRVYSIQTREIETDTYTRLYRIKVPTNSEHYMEMSKQA